MRGRDGAKQLLERAGRAERLRRSCHALRPSDARPGRLPSARRLRDLVHSARAAAAAGSPGAVEALDRQLEDTTRQVVSALSDISLPQLRATLPEVRENDPDEVAALLDVCLEALEQKPELWPVLEYLITLLASQAHGGRREVTGDPTALTELLQRRCDATRPSDEDDLELLRGEFLDAVDELERAIELTPILERLSLRKDACRDGLLVPDVLRALVRYNVAVGNRLATLLGAEKALDDADRVEAGPGIETGSLASVVLAHVGVRALQRAIASRTNGISVQPGAVFRIVARLGLERVDAREANLLLAARPSPTDEIVLAALVLGLVDERIAEVTADDLDELLLDRALLDREWLPALERALVHGIEAALVEGQDDLAQQLAEAKTKYLGHRRAAPSP